LTDAAVHAGGTVPAARVGAADQQGTDGDSGRHRA
jgi:hypothetical protein